MKNALLGIAIAVLLLGSCTGFAIFCILLKAAFKGELKKTTTKEWTEDDEP